MISVNNILSTFAGHVRHLTAIVLGAMMLTSCADDSIDNGVTDPSEGYLTLELSSTSLRTRATEEGENTRNENLIHHALVCLMPDNADVPIFMQTFTFGNNTNRTATVQLKLTRELVNQLFPNLSTTGGTTAKAYVIANLSGYSDADLKGKSIAELKVLNIRSNFASSDDQPYFVMDGVGTINLWLNDNDIAKSTVSGDIPLTRSAAKITLGVNITTDKVTDDAGREWSPLTETMSVLITNGVKSSTVVPAPGAVSAENYYSTSANATESNERGRTFVTNTEAEYPYILESPFYTYPNNWAADDTKMTYMTLSMMWNSGTAYRTCYYMVPVVDSNDYKYLSRNVSYHVNINIGILGSTNPDNPFEVKDDVSYHAVEWGKEAVNVNLDDFRYLILDQTEYDLNNEGMISIPFYSSHETVIKYDADELNYYLFNVTSVGVEREMTINNEQRNRSTTTSLPDSIGTSVKIYSDWIDNTVDATTGTRTLYFHHELYQWSAHQWINSNPGSLGNVVSFGPYYTEGATDEENIGRANAEFSQIGAYSLSYPLTAAYSRYRMKITIVHKDKLGKNDEADFSQTVYINQYPGMYIKVDKNEAEENEGNIYVNGKYKDNDALGTINGIDKKNSANTNVNMYVINVSQLSINSGYIIGDPRSQYINNDLSGDDNLIPTENGAVAGEWNTVGAALYNSTSDRKLTYYYPTNESQNASSVNMIAPKLRIASSWGGCSLGAQQLYQGNVYGFIDGTREKARRRVATYQEQGFPAGRWRLPTKGELQYITQLSADGKIPTLFTTSPTVFNNSDWYYVYWTAQGPYMIATDGTISEFDNDRTKNYLFTVRAVYDDWYWEQYEGYQLEPTTVGGTYFNYTYGDLPRSVAP